MRPGKLICTVTGHHKWDRSMEDVPESTAFLRIDCVRCGYSIDGVKARQIKRQLLASRSPRLRSVAGRLP